jgi:hypothetical protein
MEIWEIVITACTGIITLLTFLDKIGLTKKVKNTEDKFKNQNLALLAILRNELFKCFKENRDIAAWTDDECCVQTKMHEAYKALNGNGEEKIWWDKKQKWAIVSDEDYHELINAKKNI